MLNNHNNQSKQFHTLAHKETGSNCDVPAINYILMLKNAYKSLKFFPANCVMNLQSLNLSH